MPKNATTAAEPGAGPLRLAYTGEGIPPADAPLRDLDEGDLHRIARIRALLASGGEWVPPATPEDLEAVASALAASGAFSRGPVAGGPDATPPIEEPAAPAQPEA